MVGASMTMILQCLTLELTPNIGLAASGPWLLQTMKVTQDDVTPARLSVQLEDMV